MLLTIVVFIFLDLKIYIYITVIIYLKNPRLKQVMFPLNKQLKNINFAFITKYNCITLII